MRISDWSSDVCSSDLFDRRDVAVGDVTGHDVDAVTIGRRADAPGDDLAEHDASPQARMNGHAIVVEAATGIAHDPLWYRLRKRTHDQVDDAVADDHTLHDRSKIGRATGRERVGQYV